MTNIFLKFGLSRQIILYLLFGLMQLCLDSLIFLGLAHLGTDLRAANIFSRLTAALAGYLLNGLFTFKNTHSPQIKGKTLAKYLTLWTILTCLSTTLVIAGRLAMGATALPYIKFVVEGVLAAVSFIAMKLWVYRQ